MSSSSLPLYAVIELLIRVSEYNPSIGDYKDHARHTQGYVIKTTNGTILFSKQIIETQFKHPEDITKPMLQQLASSFKNSNGDV